MNEPLTLTDRDILALAHTLAAVFEDRGIIGRVEPEVLTYETAAKRLECCPETVRNLANRKELERAWIGTGAKGAPRITLASLRAYIVRKTEQADAPENSTPRKEK